MTVVLHPYPYHRRIPWSADALLEMVNLFKSFHVASLADLQHACVGFAAHAKTKELIQQVLQFLPCICVELRMVAKNVHFLSIPALGSGAQSYLWSLLVLGSEGLRTDLLDSAKMSMPGKKKKQRTKYFLMLFFLSQYR